MQINTTDNQKHPLVILGWILGAALVAAAIIGAFTVYRIRALADVVSVTGSAKIDVVADQAKWVTQVSRTVRQTALASGYAQIARDQSVVQTFLTEKGIPAEQVTVAPVFMMEVYNQNVDAEKQYTLTQNIEVQSEDVQKISELSKQASELIGKGVIFSTLSLEYYYSKLPEVRVALLKDAIADAKARADQLGSSSGKRAGTLKSASSGVVQVQSRNSTDVSDYGSYDTSKIDKQIMVTVKATFSLR